MAPWVTGLFLSPMVRTGTPPTVRTRNPVPEGHSLLTVGTYWLSPFFRRGIQPQFCVQYTASYRVFQMMGDATRPTVPPAANLRNPRLSMISSLLPYLWQVKQALLALVLPMAMCSAWQRSQPHISMVFSE